MKTTAQTLFGLIACASPAFAASGAGADEYGLLAVLFMALGAAIVVFQAIPGIMLLYSMLKGIFSADTSKAAEIK